VYVAAFDEAQRLVLTDATPQYVLQHLAAFGGRADPHPDWNALANLPADDELARFTAWLAQLLASEPLTEDIATLWFGLFNPTLDDGTVTLTLYLGGSRNPASAPDVTMDYFPEGRYYPSSVLGDIYRLAYQHDDGPGNLAEYALGLGYAGSLVAHALRTLDPTLFAPGNETRTVVVGFDSGDYVDIGTVTAEGFVPTQLA